MYEAGHNGHPPPSGVGHTLLVAPIPFQMSERELLEIFRSKATVKRVWVARDGSTGRRRAYGYVEVESPTVAELLVKQFNGKLVRGHAFSVAPIRRSTGEPHQTRNRGAAPRP